MTTTEMTARTLLAATRTMEAMTLSVELLTALRTAAEEHCLESALLATELLGEEGSRSLRAALSEHVEALSA